VGTNTYTSGIFIYEDDEEVGASTVEAEYFVGQGTGVALTNYAGCAGSRGTGWDGSRFDPVYAPFCGIYTNRSKVRIVQIGDGTSNTLAFGEVLGAANGGSYQLGLSWMGWGFSFSKYGLRGPVTAVADGIHASIYPAANWSTWGSNHLGCTQFAFGDGHVASLLNASTGSSSTPDGSLPSQMDSNWLYLQQLSGMNDGGIVPASAFGN
jgi:prepilin-type processing-associated H-X9-DG protein